jgi:hypothetical protein
LDGSGRWKVKMMEDDADNNEHGQSLLMKSFNAWYY